MTPARLREIGTALYGDRWHEPLSIDLSVSLRSLQRWASGAREIPDLEQELSALCHERSRQLARLADELT